jgi:hypothetical protein
MDIGRYPEADFQRDMGFAANAIIGKRGISVLVQVAKQDQSQQAAQQQPNRKDKAAWSVEDVRAYFNEKYDLASQRIEVHETKVRECICAVEDNVR